MQLRINALQIRKCNFLPQNHLVEADNEVSIQEAAMEYGKAHATTNELEIVQMLRVYTRRGIDLEGVVVVRGILEETIERIEHLVRKEEEEFSASSMSVRTAVSLPLEAYLETPP